MTHRPYRKPDQWQLLIAEFDASKLCAEDFCAQHDLGLKTFHRWRCEFSVHANRRQKPKDFVELKPACPVQAVEVLSLQLGDNIRLDVPQSMPIAQLAELLKAVAHA